MKNCCSCKLTKYKTDFHKDASTFDGLYAACKACKSLRMKKKWQDADYRSEKNNYRLMRVYGIDQNQYNFLLKQQNDSCAICLKHKSEFKKALAVDHCHSTGKIRGLLCAVCNKFLGHYERYLSQDQLNNFSSYLQKSVQKAIIYE